MYSVVMEQNIYHVLFYNLNASTCATHHFHIFYFLLLTLTSWSKYTAYFMLLLTRKIVNVGSESLIQEKLWYYITKINVNGK